MNENSTLYVSVKLDKLKRSNSWFLSDLYLVWDITYCLSFIHTHYSSRNRSSNNEYPGFILTMVLMKYLYKLNKRSSSDLNKHIQQTNRNETYCPLTVLNELYSHITSCFVCDSVGKCVCCTLNGCVVYVYVYFTMTYYIYDMVGTLTYQSSIDICPRPVCW